ncbi:GrpB family protein [Paenibacillus sp. Z6-24]
MEHPALGLARNEVRLAPYHPAWKEEFQRIRELIHTAIPQLDKQQIQHIGSTAIEGIQAKPVLDIALGVTHLEVEAHQYESALRSIGFYRLKVERPDEIVFARFRDPSFEIKTHFIHMLPYRSEHWQDMLFFRDYMNTHAAARQEYEAVKKAFTKQKTEGIQEYTAHKEAYIQHIFQLRNAEQ